MDHLRQTFKTLKIERSYLLLIFSYLSCANPITGLSSVVIAVVVRFNPLIMNQLMLMNGASGLLVALLVWVLSVRFKRDFKKPQNYIMWNYLLSISIVGFFIILYYTRGLLLMWASVLLFFTLSSFTVLLSVTMCVQQISKYCLEGYEGFSINFVTGTTNIAVVGTQYLVNTSLSSFIDSSHFSARSVMFVLIFCIEMSVISFLIALYFFKIKK